MMEIAQRRVLRFTVSVAAGLAALIALGVLAVARPNLICGPLDCSESAAIATLKNIHWGQQQLRERCVLDRDGDGRGEFGTFVDLVRGGMLTAAFGAPEAGRVRRAGYLFQIWLPTAGDRWTGDGSGAVSADAAEGAFWIYAWPTGENRARRVFCIDASGDVRASANRELRYLGTGSPVPVDAGMPGSDAAAVPGDNRIGRDGQPWYVVA